MDPWTREPYFETVLVSVDHATGCAAYEPTRRSDHYAIASVANATIVAPIPATANSTIVHAQAKAHYSFFDGGYQLSPMRTLWLEDLERERAQDGES